jgi:hypothetical protein
MENKMSYVLATILTALMVSQAFAWEHHPTVITVINDTDPVDLVRIAFKELPPNLPTKVSFPLDLRGRGTEIVGPIPEAGPCLRNVFIAAQSPWFPGVTKIFEAAAPMNICVETSVVVTGEWPGIGAPPGGVTITHH